MISLIESIVSILDKMIPSREQQRQKRILAEDIELKKAIETGDVKKIEEIRQRKAKYGMLFVVLACFIISGCGTTSVNNVPILGDNIPVKLKIGSTAIAEAGDIITVQSNKNTLVSDAYIYQSVTSPDVKKN